MGEADPFARARARSRRAALRVAAAVVAALALALPAAWLIRRRSVRPALPGPLVAALARADFGPPRAPDAVFERLEGVLPPGSPPQQVALSEGGALVVARDEGAGTALVRVDTSGGAPRVTTHPLPDARVSALAFDPEARLYVGTSTGGLLVTEPDGGAPARTPQARAPASTVVQFAFDRASPTVAVLFAGGEVFTAPRPLAPAALAPVSLPADLRARRIAFTAEGELAVAGMDGRVYLLDGGAWSARPLPTPGDVAAAGTDLAGAVLLAQANGWVFRLRGATWEQLGRVPATPVAVGELGDERGAPRAVAVLTSDGRLFTRGEGAGDFGAEPSVPVLGVLGGQILGANVALLSRDRVRVWDVAGAPPWDSAADAVAAPPGAAPRGCEVVTMGARRVPEPPFPLLRCAGALRAIDAATRRLVPAPPLAVGGAVLPPDELLRLLARYESALYVGGELLRAHAVGDEPPSVLAWRAGAGRTVPVVTLPPEEGDVDAWSAAPGRGGVDVVTVSARGFVRYALVEPGADAPVLAARLADPAELARLRGGEPLVPDVHALGDGVALLEYASAPLLLARARSLAPGVLEPVPIRVDPAPWRAEPDGRRAHLAPPASEHVVLAAPGGAWLLREGVHEHLGLTGDAESFARDVGGHRILGARGTIARAADGGHWAITTHVRDGRTRAGVVRCDAARSCVAVPLPDDVAPRALTPLLGAPADGRSIGVLEQRGTLGVLRLPEPSRPGP
jgi:hypothetical protein